MSFRSTRYFVPLFILFSLADLAAQELSIGAQIRPRGEYRNGFKTLTESGKPAAFFIEQRTRFWTDYKTEKIRLHINFQDVRIWGATDQIYKSDPNLFNIYEGWGQFWFNPSFSMRVGRMALNYNNARFLGNLDWAAQGRSHDALLLMYEKPDSDWKLHVGAAFNQTATPSEPRRLSSTFYDQANYKTMQFAWFQKKLSSTDISFLFQNDGRQSPTATDTTVMFRQTYAAIVNHTGSSFNIGGELYYQGGKNPLRTDVSALLLALYFTYKTDITPVTIGVDYLSGTSLNDTDDKSFEPLYGTNHKFYGFMDYFYVGNSHGQTAYSSGLTDIYIKTNWKLGGITSLIGHFHAFSSPAQLYSPSDGTTEISSYLGTEVDLILVIKPTKYVKIDLGYSQMFATSSMEAIKIVPGDHAVVNNWAWFMIDFNPVIFSKKFKEE